MVLSEFLFVCTLLLASPAGAQLDLLSVVPTEQYWEHLGRPDIDAAQLRAILEGEEAGDVSELIEQLGDARFEVRERATHELIRMGPANAAQLEQATRDPDTEIATRARRVLASIAEEPGTDPATRKLMAIRTLGERGDREALPLLRPLADSEDISIADAAARAIGRITDQPHHRPAPTHAQRAADVALLPRGADIVLHLARTDPPHPRADAIVPDLVEALVETERRVLGEEGEDPQQADLDYYESPLINPLKLLDRIGNVQLDAVTAGIEVKGNEEGARGVAVLRGRFDIGRMLEALADHKHRHKDVDYVLWDDGLDHIAMVVVSQHRLVFLFESDGDGRGAAHRLIDRLSGDAEMQPPRLVAQAGDLVAEEGPAMWIIAEVPQFIREEPGPIGSLKAIRLEVGRDGQRLDVSAKLEAKDEHAAGVIGAAIMLGHRQYRAQLAALAQEHEAYKPALGPIDSVRIEADGATLHMNGSSDGLDPIIALDQANTHLILEQERQWRQEHRQWQADDDIWDDVEVVPSPPDAPAAD